MSEPPSSYLCPITHEVMTDPVSDHEGHTYERHAIETALSQKQESPITRSHLTKEQLIPNRSLRDAIEEWRRSNGILDGNNNCTVGAAPPEVNDELPVSFSIHSCTDPQSSDSLLVMAEVSPIAQGDRVPVDIACVVDISGSMGAEATIQSQSGASESHGLSLLDIVKHAVRTIIGMLGDCDRLALVTYSNNATTVFPLHKMHSSGKAMAERELESLRPYGGTNLWDGLQTALELMRSTERQGRMSSTLLLTDGVPNVNPPRGILPMLDRYNSRFSLPSVINTFGFGYNLESDLLEAIAIKGRGMYSFIPDAGFVGTTFVHTLSNTLVQIAEADIELQPGDHIAQTRVIADRSGTLPKIPIGTLEFGSRKSVVLRCPASVVGTSMVLHYTHHRSRTQSCEERIPEPSDNSNVLSEARRLLFVECIESALSKGKQDLVKAQGEIASLREDLIKLGGADGDTLMKDLDGQVAEAFSRQDWFDRWGVHYLRSLVLAHRLRQCTNFKDPGIQEYGTGVVFEDLRDQADDLFMKLPPPTPSVAPRPQYPSPGGQQVQQSAPRPVQSMAVYNSCDNPCFDGGCLVTMADGTTQTVASIQKGDVVRSANMQTAKVLCVLKTRIDGGQTSLVKLNGLLITPWHPIKLDGRWTFPSELSRASVRYCNAVYSFVLEDSRPSIWINGTECLCLGHGITDDDVAAHTFFGTETVVDHLKTMAGWSRGLVTMRQGCVLKDNSSGLAIGFAPDAEIQQFGFTSPSEA